MRNTTSVNLYLQREEKIINDRYAEQLRQLQKAHAWHYTTWPLYLELRGKLEEKRDADICRLHDQEMSWCHPRQG